MGFIGQLPIHIFWRPIKLTHIYNFQGPSKRNMSILRKSYEASCCKQFAVFTFYEVNISCLRTFMFNKFGFHYFTHMKRKHSKIRMSTNSAQSKEYL
jgi:hypothetical protein